MPLNRKPDGIKVGGLLGAKKDAYINQRTDRVVFIPWDMPKAQEWVDKSDQWNIAKRANGALADMFELVIYDPLNTPHPALTRIAADPGAVIYLRGHGNPGAPYIQVKIDTGINAATNLPNPVLEEKLPIDTACQRLIDMGLPAGYPGVIKFYSCHSGTTLMKADFDNTVANVRSRHADADTLFQQGDFTAQQRDTNKAKYVAPLAKSLAAQGAAYLRARGYTHCKYYGYLGPLGSQYDQDQVTQEWHKVVELNGLHSAPKHLRTNKSQSTITTDKPVRPSIARVRV